MRSIWLTGIGLALLCLVGCGGSEENHALCTNPAPVLGTFDPDAPGYIVLFHDDIDSQVATSQLATLYGFQPTHIYEYTNGFSAVFSTDVLEHLRCEASIKNIAYDQAAFPVQ
jgi:hypothetical protein